MFKTSPVLVFVVLLLSGCGGDKQSSTTETPSSTTETPSSTTETPSSTTETSSSTTDITTIIKKTGQTTSYIDYDDGYYQKGISPSYTRASDIVTDELTHLMWQDDESPKNPKSYEEAKTYCSYLTLGGYTDWRLPTMTELEGIVDYGSIEPVIDTNYFQNIRYFQWEVSYWSSTLLSGWSGYGWYINFNNGTMQVSSDKHTRNYYICVRDGQ